MVKTPKVGKRTPAVVQARRAAIAKGVIDLKPTSKIAEELGIGRKAVWVEANQPETKALIQEWMKPHHDRLKRIAGQAVAQVERALTLDEEGRLDRIAALTDRIQKMRQVISDRSEEAGLSDELSSIPGMLTGTMVHRQKAIGSFGVTTEYEVDSGLLKELREHEKQLRDELNDFTPNLAAIARARELMELAEGTKHDGGIKPTGGTLEELLTIYRRVTITQE